MAIGDAYKGLIEAVKEQGNVDDNPILTNILDTVKMTGQSLMDNMAYGGAEQGNIFGSLLGGGNGGSSGGQMGMPVGGGGGGGMPPSDDRMTDSYSKRLIQANISSREKRLQGLAGELSRLEQQLQQPRFAGNKFMQTRYKNLTNLFTKEQTALKDLQNKVIKSIQEEEKQQAEEAKKLEEMEYKRLENQENKKADYIAKIHEENPDFAENVEDLSLPELAAKYGKSKKDSELKKLIDNEKTKIKIFSEKENIKRQSSSLEIQKELKSFFEIDDKINEQRATGGLGRLLKIPYFWGKKSLQSGKIGELLASHDAAVKSLRVSLARTKDVGNLSEVEQEAAEKRIPLPSDTVGVANLKKRYIKSILGLIELRSKNEDPIQALENIKTLEKQVDINVKAEEKKPGETRTLTDGRVVKRNEQGQWEEIE